MAYADKYNSIIIPLADDVPTVVKVTEIEGRMVGAGSCREGKQYCKMKETSCAAV